MNPKNTTNSRLPKKNPAPKAPPEKKPKKAATQKPDNAEQNANETEGIKLPAEIMVHRESVTSIVAAILAAAEFQKNPMNLAWVGNDLGSNHLRTFAQQADQLMDLTWNASKEVHAYQLFVAETLVSMVNAAEIFAEAKWANLTSKQSVTQLVEEVKAAIRSYAESLPSGLTERSDIDIGDDTNASYDVGFINYQKNFILESLAKIEGGSSATTKDGEGDKSEPRKGVALHDLLYLAASHQILDKKLRRAVPKEVWRGPVVLKHDSELSRKELIRPEHAKILYDLRVAKLEKKFKNQTTELKHENDRLKELLSRFTKK